MCLTPALFLLSSTLPAPHELVVFAHVLDGLPPAAHLSVSRLSDANIEPPKIPDKLDLVQGREERKP